MRRTLSVLLVVGVAALAAAPVAAGGTRTVKLGDNFFAPATLTVKSGTILVWRWPDTGTFHDVALTRRPKGVRRFASKVKATGEFRRRLRKPGGYLFICTLHSEMSMRVTVTRR